MTTAVEEQAAESCDPLAHNLCSINISTSEKSCLHSSSRRAIFPASLRGNIAFRVWPLLQKAKSNLVLCHLMPSLLAGLFSGEGGRSSLTSNTLSVGLSVADVGLTSTETSTAESLLLSMLSPRSYARTRGCLVDGLFVCRWGLLQKFIRHVLERYTNSLRAIFLRRGCMHLSRYSIAIESIRLRTG